MLRSVVGSCRRLVISASAAAVVLLGVAAPAQAAPAAAGAPGDKQTFAAADKHGFGTAAGGRSRVWFTLRSAELTEVYYPDAGTPSMRTLQFAVRDGTGSSSRPAPGAARSPDSSPPAWPSARRSPPTRAAGP